MSSVLSEKHFHNEAAAYAFVEARVWPEGPICPHCGGFERIGKMGGKSTRIGVYKCYQCRKPFTVKVGTVFEASHVPMHLWLQAMFLLSSSKKGISANQLHRTLGVTLKTAWFMAHRVREAMRLVGFEPMGGAGAVVEADETYFGDKELVTKRTKKGKSGHSSKRAIVALVERGGQARTFHVDRADKVTVTEIVSENIARETRLMTDESRLYADALNHVAEHDHVKHSAGEYVRGDINTNTVEGYFSIFKRGMKGIYQHCSEKHLHRYLSEFDFRYNNRVALGVNDTARTDAAIRGIVGKRLTYRTIN
ncbi:IS1595 family transposase [Bosea vaviloviae]|uniref:Transposase n=1 Tax=Bosea vaviloviae TaxID=1526658 RepID=A0A0N1F6Q7_9HYPH|nr:IS1595 family transposase [Bosea vaviloviae]KPH82509.1 transposase [Bosea vaviloviae]